MHPVEEMEPGVPGALPHQFKKVNTDPLNASNPCKLYFAENNRISTFHLYQPIRYLWNYDPTAKKCVLFV
jgi:hypothetical protein